jgi:uncharacterized protein (DUF1778 family)
MSESRRRTANSRADLVRDPALRTFFVAGPKAYRWFLARLDAPAHPNERLRKSMRTPAPWELGTTRL